jgi:carbon storage regulator
MLVLTRKVGQTIRVGDIVITVTSVRGRQVRIGIDAPRNVPIQRGELPDAPPGPATFQATAFPPCKPIPASTPRPGHP